jgi:hypothetical protein
MVHRYYFADYRQLPNLVSKLNIVHSQKNKRTMKTIILLSSIFYILGLKIGHKIDLFKNYNPVQKISTTTNAVKQAAKAVYFNDEVKLKNSPDSIKSVGAVDKTAKEKNHF